MSGSTRFTMSPKLPETVIFPVWNSMVQRSAIERTEKTCQPRQGKLATFDYERVIRPLNSGLGGSSDFSGTKDMLNPRTGQGLFVLFTVNGMFIRIFLATPY